MNEVNALGSCSCSFSPAASGDYGQANPLECEQLLWEVIENFWLLSSQN